MNASQFASRTAYLAYLGTELLAKINAHMNVLTFGVELETEGRSIETCARAIAAEFDGWIAYAVGGHYRKWEVSTMDGRFWTCMSDASLVDGCEVVSPICTMADMDTVQRVVRAVRKCGAHVSERCGMHVHVGGVDPASVGRLARNVAKDEDLFQAAFKVNPSRTARWCRPVPSSFLTALAAVKSSNKINLETLRKVWYSNVNDNGRSVDARSVFHYDPSRYHGLNLHSYFFRGTVEFRYFEGTLHAGVVRANIMFCLGLAAQAMATKHANAVAPRSAQNMAHRMALLTKRWGLKDATVLAHLQANIAKRKARTATIEAAA
jgi:hypothetical protein